ncbi:MAG: hypothetical protein JNM82_01455 [Rhodocyclaceae bacterium]|nr:hypothetical protein [Rhodocyclaceae bacterium]
MRALFRQAGLPLRPPPAGDCGEGAGTIDADGMDGPPRIVAPLRGVTHLRRVGRAEPLLLKAESAGRAGALHWFADDALVGRAKPGETLIWNPPQAGRYLLRVVDAGGQADSREVVVELAP